MQIKIQKDTLVSLGLRLGNNHKALKIGVWRVSSYLNKATVYNVHNVVDSNGCLRNICSDYNLHPHNT